MAAAEGRSPEPVRIAPHELDRAGLVLARAFVDYPEIAYAIPDPSRRHALSPVLWQTVAAYCHLYGRLCRTPGFEAVAAWLTPGSAELTLGRMSRSGMIALGPRLGWRACRRLLRVTALTDRLRRSRMPGPHWYLWAVGVEPASQHRGLGSGLLRPVLDRLDATAETCYLETSVKALVPWYASLGFRVVGQVALPGGGLEVWGMRREPGAAMRRLGSSALCSPTDADPLRQNLAAKLVEADVLSPGA